MEEVREGKRVKEKGRREGGSEGGRREHVLG